MGERHGPPTICVACDGVPDHVPVVATCVANLQAALRTARGEADEWRVVTDGTTPSEVLTRLATLTRERDEARAARDATIRWARDMSERCDAFTRRAGGNVVKPNAYDELLAALTPTPPPADPAR